MGKSRFMILLASFKRFKEKVMVLGGSSCSMFVLLLSAHIRSGGRIFFDSLPYDPQSFGSPTVFLTFLINLALFAAFAMIVFIAVREFGAFTKRKRTIPYCLITVALGIPIDILFLFLADRFYPGLYQGSGVFIDNFMHGFAVTENVNFLIVPSLVALSFLFFVQAILIRLFYKEISNRKRLIMSALISVLTLPTWATLILLAVLPKMPPAGG